MFHWIKSKYGWIIICVISIRVMVLGLFWDHLLTIVDEQHYNILALNILEHGEFALNKNHLTAIRPPLYPAFIAGIYYLAGSSNPDYVRIIQILISLFTGGIFYLFRLFDVHCGKMLKNYKIASLIPFKLKPIWKIGR